MMPGIYDFEDQYKGYTFRQVDLDFTKVINGVETPLDLTNVRILMQWKKRQTSEIADKSISDGDGITFLDASIGKIRIQQFDITMDAFTYFYDIQLIYPNDIKRTYMMGVYPVKQDTSR